MRKHEGRWLAHAGSSCRHEKPFPPVTIPVEQTSQRHSGRKTFKRTDSRSDSLESPPGTCPPSTITIQVAGEQDKEREVEAARLAHVLDKA